MSGPPIYCHIKNITVKGIGNYNLQPYFLHSHSTLKFQNLVIMATPYMKFRFRPCWRVSKEMQFTLCLLMTQHPYHHVILHDLQGL